MAINFQWKQNLNIMHLKWNACRPRWQTRFPLLGKSDRHWATCCLLCRRRLSQASNARTWCWLYQDPSERLTAFTQVGKYLGSWTFMGWEFPCTLSRGVSSSPIRVRLRWLHSFIHSSSFIHKIRIKHLLWGGSVKQLPLKGLRKAIYKHPSAT